LEEEERAVQSSLSNNMIVADFPVDDIWLAGDTHTLELFLEEEGEPLPLAGYNIVFSMKISKDDADNAFTTIQKFIGDGIEIIAPPPEGHFLVTIDGADTDWLEKDTTFYFDIQLSQGGETFTVAVGTLTFSFDVTQKKS
jgi:hypothetical protein